LASGPAAPAATTEPEWLAERRRKGAALASELDLPTAKDKGWEFTDLSGLDLDSHAPAGGTVTGVSQGTDSDDGPPVVMPLEEAARQLSDIVRERFGSVVPVSDPFVARNEANWRDGALVYVPRGTRLEHPLELSVVHDGDGSGLDWRTLIAMRKLARGIRLAALTESDQRDFAAISKDAANAEIVSPRFDLVTPEKVAAAHAARLQVVPWTPNSPEGWDKMIAAKVDAIITDEPAALIAHLKARK